MSTRRYLSHGLTAADRSRAGWGWLPQPVTPPKASWRSVLRYHSAVARRLLTVLTLPCVDVLPPRTPGVCPNCNSQLSQARATRFSRGSMLRDVCTPATRYRSFLLKSCVHNSYTQSISLAVAPLKHAQPTGGACRRARQHTRTVSQSRSHTVGKPKDARGARIALRAPA